MRRIPASFALLILFLSVAGPLWSDDAKRIEEARRDTIRYGTDGEIIKLVAALEEEKAEYLDKELASVLESTKNGKIAAAIYGFFGRRKDPLVEARAVRTVEERDQESNEAVDAAIDYLGKIESLDAPAALRQILDAEETRFLIGAIAALGKSGKENADDNASYLIRYYDERDASDSAKQAIVSALGSLKAKTATTFLAGIVSDRDEKPVRRMAALESLGMIADPEALDSLIEALSSADPNVRASAVSALGPFKERKADEAILEAFRDSYYKVRSGAAKAAGERKLDAAVPYLRYRSERDEVPAVRDAAIAALGEIGNGDAIAALRNLFDEKTTLDSHRVSAATALLKHGAEKDAQEIVTALDEAKKEKRTALYNGLLKALSAAKSTALEDFARRLLGSEDLMEKLYGIELVRQNAYRSLKGELKKLAEDKNPSLAGRAKSALEKLGSD